MWCLKRKLFFRSLATTLWGIVLPVTALGTDNPTPDWSWPEPTTYSIAMNSDDGTECNGIWYPNGIALGINRVGCCACGPSLVAFRFAVPDLEQGEQIEYARLLLSAQGGAVGDRLTLCIRGIAEDSPGTFSDSRRPSTLPQTSDSVLWCLVRTWESTGREKALYRATPNIAPLINEILARPNWGTGQDGKQLALIIVPNSPCETTNYLDFEDFSTEWEIRDQARLQICRTVSEAFVAKPMLGRITDTSVVVNLMNLLQIDVYAEYGTQSGSYELSTAPLLNQPPASPIELTISGLAANTRYYYRIRYRRSGSETYLSGPEGDFHTYRPRGNSFVFVVEADVHPELVSAGGSGSIDPSRDWQLYEVTLQNMANDDPDFIIDLGDFADIQCEGYSRSILSAQEAIQRYLDGRAYLDRITHSIPFYLVIGNHEGEQGWRVANPDDSIEVWGCSARNALIPNPDPNGFYTGDNDTTTCCGIRRTYYAWEWGDALFVVLDPFWNTQRAPHWYSEYPCQGDGWEWTIGSEQYRWLYETLHNSTAQWKFVFSHHETGGVLTGRSYYGRGGIESAKYFVDHRPSFEWGGEDSSGNYIFASMRPGWDHGPIHDMMVQEGVTIFFHGHDHVYVTQVLDGIVYQACPRPKDSAYSDGFYDDGHYRYGVKHNNSGYLRVEVCPESVRVSYVRSVLPDDEPLVEDSSLVYNGTVSHSYTIATNSGRIHRTSQIVPRLLLCPNPIRWPGCFRLFLRDPGHVRMALYDARGRFLGELLNRHFTAGWHLQRWDKATIGSGVPPGVYFVRAVANGYELTNKIVLVR